MARNNKVTGWVGWVYFAAFMLLLSGIFQLISGLAALVNPGFYAAQNGTLVVFDLNTWGWIYVLLGVVMMCAGTALFSGRLWARVVAVVLAALNIVAHFTFLSEYPLWSIIMIVVNVLIIHALTVHGDELVEE